MVNTNNVIKWIVVHASRGSTVVVVVVIIIIIIIGISISTSNADYAFGPGCTVRTLTCQQLLFL